MVDWGGGGILLILTPIMDFFPYSEYIDPYSDQYICTKQSLKNPTGTHLFRPLWLDSLF